MAPYAHQLSQSIGRQITLRAASTEAAALKESKEELLGNFVLRRFRAAPWRFGADDYGGANADVELSLSDGGRVEADWDDKLAPALAQRGIAIHEEAVVETLLLDLGRH